VRILLGLLKGGIIGGALGYGFYLTVMSDIGALHYVLYGVIGALVGFIAGKPFWRHDTIWTPVVKAVVGFAICVGLYALVAKALGDPGVDFIEEGMTATKYPFVFGALVGVVYGVFVEVDDGGKAKKEEAKKKESAKQ
jgi:hypothetical protein